MVSIKKILCPVDFSACSDEALKYAAYLALKESAKLYLIHVIDVRMYGHETPISFKMPEPDAETIERMKKELKASISSQKIYEKINLETIVTVGIPATEIIKAAKEKQVDMIVMGTHGRTGLAHVIVGSVAENVVRRASCPVLTVRHP
jgi:nucleotide-binding universal stress UspA family protein